jgi:Tfp pilus assembly protein PilF
MRKLKENPKTTPLILKLSLLFTFISFGYVVSILVSERKIDKKDKPEISPTVTVTPGTMSGRQKELNYFYAVKNVNDGNFDAAVTQLGEVIKTDPGQVTALYLLGYSYRKLKQPDLALENYKAFLEKADKTNNYRLSAMIELGYLYLKKNRETSAENIIQNAEKEATESKSDKLPTIKAEANFIFNETGHKLMDEKKFSEAKWRLEKAVQESNGSYTWANINLTRLNVRTAEEKFSNSDFDSARTDLKTARSMLENAPTDWKSKVDYLIDRVNYLEEKLKSKK